MAYQQPQGDEAYIFVLRDLNVEAQVQETIVNFTPNRALLQKQGAFSKIAIPAFNQDRHYFTPAFLLPLDENFYKLNETFERYQFEEQIKRNLQFLRQNKTQCTQQNIKLSSPNADYCQICRQKYSNYFEHISESTHFELVKNNEINKSIQQMCSNFNNKGGAKVHKISKGSKNKKTHLSKHEKPVTRSTKMRSIQSNRSQSSNTTVESS